MFMAIIPQVLCYTPSSSGCPCECMEEWDRPSEVWCVWIFPPCIGITVVLYGHATAWASLHVHGRVVVVCHAAQPAIIEPPLVTVLVVREVIGLVVRSQKS
jgi:hypothetical protein